MPQSNSKQVSPLTKQGQRPGIKHATAGTKASKPGSLHRMVRPSDSWCKRTLDGIKPPLRDDLKTLIMGWVASENRGTTSREPNTEPDSQRQKRVPIPAGQDGSKCLHPAQELSATRLRRQPTLAEFCIRISCDVVPWPNDPSSPTAAEGDRERAPKL